MERDMERQSREDIELEAEEYVNSVMSSQPPAATLRTPLPSGRKRSLSASAADTEVKKRRSEGQSDSQPANRNQARARRSILQIEDQTAETAEKDAGSLDDSQPSSTNIGRRQAKATRKGRAEDSIQRGDDVVYVDDHSAAPVTNSDSDIKVMLRKLSDDMMSMHSALNKKIDLIENMIEQSEKKITEKVTDKVTKIIDKRVNTETARLRKEIDNKIQGLRDDFNAELNEINNRLDNERQNNTNVNDTERHLRVVVRNLPQAVNEDIQQKVDSVIRDGLKIADVKVVSAERKDSRQDSRPGVVIAKFRNSEDKKRVMSAKRSLRNNRQYSRVYINHDLSKEERNLATNMRTLVNGVRRGQNLELRGTRIVASEDTGDRDERRGGTREGGANSGGPAAGYRSRDMDRNRNTQRQNGDRSRDTERSDSRNGDNGQRRGQRETTRDVSRGYNQRGQQNQWNRHRH